MYMHRRLFLVLEFEGDLHLTQRTEIPPGTCRIIL